MHEMPAENCLRIIKEMFRLLKSGGIMNGFDVPYKEDYLSALIYAEFNTWGHKWDAPGEKGPEPYVEEYEFGSQLTKSFEDVGFIDISQEEYTYFESIFQASKP